MAMTICASTTEPVIVPLTGLQSVSPVTSTSNVVFMRFTSDGSTTSPGFQFSYTSHTTYEACGLSVFRHFPQTDCGGAGVDIASHVGVTLEFCVNACCANSTCLSFQYNSQTTNCYLKNKVCSAAEKASSADGNMYDRLDGCRDGYSYLAHTHMCYRAYDRENTYDEALTTCQADGGTLAMPRDNATNDFLIALKNDANATIWFNFGVDRRDGSWNYIDGGELIFTDWGEGEPNNEAEQCAQYFSGTYSDAYNRNKWNDGQCSRNVAFICEVGVNVALGKTAFQTSNYANGGAAGLAVDGNTATNWDAGTCTHTTQEDNPTWWMDLGQSYVIGRAVIFNRQDCCAERINPFNIHIGDSDQVSANPRCGECLVAGYVRFNGVCYKDFAEEMAYDEARQTCARDGGLLAMPKDVTINNFLHDLAGGGDRWIGLNDANNEGQFVFEDGQTLGSSAYNNWYPGEPNDAGGDEDCAVIRPGNEWNDASCSTVRGFVCQLAGGYCQPDPCVNGTCISGADNYTCVCDDGFEGETCGIPIALSHGLTISTSDSDHSGTTDALTVKIFSDVCDDACATTTVSGLTAVGTEYTRTFIASNFGDPTRLQLTTSGSDWLKLDWIDVYNAYTGLSYRFACPGNGCQLSTDSSEASEQLELDVDTSCPQNNSLVLPSGKTYSAAEDKRNYSGAQEECRRRGGIVAIPRNEEEQRNLVFLKNCISSGSQFWLGIMKTTGVWKDGRGTALGAFTSWASGEPNQWERNCSHIIFGDKEGERRDKWADAGCLSQWRYVCEIEDAVDYCQPNPCVNGTCISVADNYTCACDDGYEGETCQFPIGDQKRITFPGPRSTSNYARLGTSLSQDLTGFTLCLHMRTDMSSSSDAGLVSYAVNQEYNELLLFDRGGNGLELYVQGETAVMGTLPVWDGARHVICVTWRSNDGAWQVYADGMLKTTGSGLRVGGKVRSGGTFILAQDQDTVGGGFAANQAFIGELSQVNLWDRVLSPAEVGSDWAAFCNHHGNVIDWATETIQVLGKAVSDQYSCLGSSAAGLWPLNARYGASDITGNGNNGTATGTQLAPGPYGDDNGAFQFSGTADSYIDIPNNGKLDVRYSYTILAHIYPTGEAGPIFDYVGNNGWAVHLWQTSPQELFMRPVGRDGHLSPGVIADVLQQNAWNYVGGTYNHVTGNASIWINDALVSESHIGVADVASQYPIRVAERDGDSRIFEGRIACLQLYNYAMAEEQIVAVRDVCREGCPVADYVRFNGVCYRSFTELKTRAEASQTCAANGGILAMPKDSATNTFLANLAEIVDGRWLGLTDANNDGQWEFEDGQTLTSSDFSNWRSGEPAPDNGCVGFWGAGSKWNTKDCSYLRGFICQLDEAVDYCQPNPCVNGTCISGADNYTCVCDDDYEGETCQVPIGCTKPLGMESGDIPDDSITASSIWGPDHEPYRGRLNGVAGIGAWAALTNTIGEWLQVDLGELKRVVGTSIQRHHGLDQWVTSYKLQCSVDAVSWTIFKGSDGSDKVFPGNTDRNATVTNLLHNPSDTRYVRFLPQSWYGWMSMRVEILGCDITGVRLPRDPSWIVDSTGTPWVDNGVTYNAAKALDGDIGTYWNVIDTPQNHNNWYIVLDFTGPQTLTRIAVNSYGDTTHDIAAFKLQKSQSESPYNWEDAVSVDNVQGGTNQSQEFGGFQGTARYWRFVVTRTHEGWQPYLTELNFYGISSELCQVGDGVSYRGTGSVTETGKTCQRWDSQTPHEHSYTTANYPSSGLEENYCRNTGDWTGVWCYTTDNDTRWELCDVPACGTSCPQLTPVQHGGTSGGSYYGDVVTYHCDPGYEISGDEKRTCQSDQTWSGTQPTCNRKACPELPVPNNGSKNEGHLYGDIVTFSCTEGYELIGSVNRTCQANQSWSGIQPNCSRTFCQQLTPVQHGSISGSRYYGDVVTFYCDPGYDISGVEERTCQSDQTWSGTQPTCSRKACPELPVPNNGSRTESHLYGDIVTFTCDEGYELIGSVNRTCQANQSWSGIQPNCSRTPCPQLTPVQHGGTSGGSYYGDVVTYHCDPGYEISGVEERTCQSDQTWSDTQPTCNRKACPELPVPNNGSRNEGHLYGDKVKFSCNEGYELIGSVNRTCQANQSWSGIQPNCSRTPCPQLTPVQHGGTSGGSYYGDVVTYHCDPGYEISGDEKRTCQSDQTWSGTQPTCSRKACPELPVPNNGSRTESHLYGDIVTFTCDEGYELIGSVNRTCQANQSWSGIQPNCSRTPCPQLTPVQHGGTSGGSYYGDVVTYHCDPGYEISGVEERTCQSDQTWSGTQPTCSRKACPELAVPNNGIRTEGHLYGDIVTFTCDEGYELIGSVNRTCQADQSWSGIQPTCGGTACNDTFQDGGQSAEYELQAASFPDHVDIVIFTVEVSLDGRESSQTSQSVTLQNGTVLNIAIRCDANCEAKASPSERLVLVTECDNCPAASTTYQWTLKGERHIDWDVDTTTGNTSQNLVLRSNIFEAGGNYTIRVDVTSDDEPWGTGFSEYSFSVNTPPTVGSCVISPSSGVHDDDKPLVYSLYFNSERSDDSTYTLLHTGTTRRFPPQQLPTGQERRDFNITLEVRVSDGLGATTIIRNINVQVRPPSVEDTEAALGSLNDTLDNLLDTGDHRALLQLTNSLSSVLNAANTSAYSNDALSTARDGLINSLGTIPVQSLEKIGQVSSALGQATASEEQVTPDSQNFKTPRNPYAFANTSPNVKSEVAGLQFMRNGSPVEIRDLPAPVETHQFNATKGRPLYITVTPHLANVSVRLYLKRGQEPRRIEGFDRNTTLPLPDDDDLFTLSLGTETLTADRWTWFIPGSDVEDPMEYMYYLGVQHVLQHGDVTPSVSPEYRGENFTLNYTVQIYSTQCLYFDEDIDDFRSDGCRPGPLSNTSLSHCRCDHLTAFGSGFQFFVAPNKLNVLQAFKNLNFKENPVVVIAISVVVGIYLLVVIWARRKDRQDSKKVGATILRGDQKGFNDHFYQIIVLTGSRSQSSTSARVFLTLIGEGGESGPHELEDHDRTIFREGGVDTFILPTSRHLGSLYAVHIWHDNTGPCPSWFLDKIILQDLSDGKKYSFLCQRWLAVEEGDGRVDCLLSSATDKQISTLSHVFNSQTSKAFNDGHLWCSVVGRPAYSPFTRVQRVSCCLSLLLCTMVTNIMFFGRADDFSKPPPVDILGFKVQIPISWAQIIIGVQSCLIIFPINLAIVEIFRHVASPPERKTNDQNVSRASSTSSDVISLEEIELQKIDKAWDFYRLPYSDRKVTDDKKKGCILPWWCVFIAWFLVFASCFLSALFTILYGSEYGREKAEAWLFTFFTSFFTDLLILQPVKVVLLAVGLTLLLRKPHEDAENLTPTLDYDEVCSYLSTIKVTPAKKCLEEPPDSTKLAEMRVRRFVEISMKSAVYEFVFYFMFVLVLAVIANGPRDTGMFHMTRNIRQTMDDGDDHSFKQASTIDVNDVQSFWNFIRYTLSPALYDNQWYNGDNREPDGFMTDKTSYVVGPVRLRQLRVAEDSSCKRAEPIEGIFNDCIDAYSYLTQDSSSYGMGWLKTSDANASGLVPNETNPWVYQQSSDIPVVGTHETYWDGGYFVKFTNTTPTAVLATVAQLEPSGWIDRYTRAVLIEMTIYNPHANLFSVVNLLTEFTAIGSAYPHVDITTVRLYRFQTTWAWVVVCFQGIFIIFTLYFAFKELDHILKLRCLYLKTFWGCVELSLALLSLAEVGVMLYTLYIVLEFQSKQGANTGPVERTFEKYRRAAYWDQINTYVLGCLVCMGTIKLLHLLRFNKHVVLGADTIKKAAGPLSGFLLIFTLVFLAFAMFASLVFGSGEEGFSPFIATLETMFTILLGRFYEMSDRNRIMGPLFTFTFITFFQWVIITMVVAILDCAIHEVAEENTQQKPETEQVADLMLERLQSWVGGVLQRGERRSSSVIKEDYSPTEEELMDFFTKTDFIRFRGRQDNSSADIEFCIENQISSGTV
ncbi:CSMD3 [Branchiostoma lanceolatum]|uniref:CSMD3 protein n=1 Tax=Branchiostoma lanceolatum TaxID=7740 RepID=A0A8K0EY55_BRALA|nr:CSMD3 [Branchiostoma lanceolatum]